MGRALWRLLGGGVDAWAWFDVADVDVFEGELRCVVYVGGLGGFEERFVITVGEFRLVVGSARLVAEAGALNNDAGQLKHVPELASEGEAGVGPLALVGEVDVAVAVEEFDELGVGF